MPVPQSFRPKINDVELDRDLADQSGMHYDVGVAKAASEETVAYAKANVDLVKAELELEIRTSPEEFNIAKPTEATIAATVTVQPRYQAALQAQIVAQHDDAVVRAALSASDHKKSMLGKCVDLYLSNYNSEPRPAAATASVAAEINKRSVRSGAGVRPDLPPVIPDDDEAFG